MPYLKASEMGSAWGELNVVRMHERGIGVYKNPTKALRLYMKVASISGADLQGQWSDLRSEAGKVTDLPPCPKSCWSPRWSPDGHYIVGLTYAEDDLALFDLRTNQWSLLNPQCGRIGWPSWSHDGHFIYFEGTNFGITTSSEPGIYRIPVTGGRAEKVVDLKGFRGTGFLWGWYGLDSDDNSLILRDTGTFDVYFLALERKQPLRFECQPNGLSMLARDRKAGEN